jgi:hypothetical protein
VAVTGVHLLQYTPQAEELRAFFRDVLDWKHVESHPGWLIFALPPAELGVHPSDGSAALELWLMCDELAATMDDLRGKGVEFRGEPEDADFGRWVGLIVPGDAAVYLYEPRHPQAI